MKKLIIAIIALMSVGAFAGETVRIVEPTMATGTNTAVATFTASANRVTYPLAVYQVVGGTTQTNTVTMTKTISGVTGSFSEGTLTAVATGVGDQTIGMGDVSADVDDIVILPGGTFVLSGAGTASSNVTYRILIKEIDQ